MLRTDRHRGQAAVAAIGVLLALAAAASAVLGLARTARTEARAAAAADAAALAGARVLQARYGDLFPRRDPASRRTLPPRLTRRAYEALAADAARGGAAGRGADVVALAFDRTPVRPGPWTLRVRLRLRAAGLPRWLHAARVRAAATAEARAGVGWQPPPAVPGAPRPVALAGLDGAAAVVAAAEAQLGWPYVWGGESRAEGGFDCSGLVAYALDAAGYGVGRPTAEGLRRLAVPIALDPAELRAGDLVFVGLPATHVGLYAGGGRVLEAPHQGAVVRYADLADGAWTGAGRVLAVDAAAAAAPDWVPPAFRPLVVEAGRREQVPPALLAAQLEAESGFAAAAVSPAGALGAAQFLPATWAGDWNPYREHSPYEPRYAVLAQARYLARLLARAGGDVPRALAAYNAGWSGSAGSWPRETQAYVAQVMARFGGPGAVAPPPLAAGGGAASVAPAGRQVVRLLPLADDHDPAGPLRRPAAAGR